MGFEVTVTGKVISGGQLTIKETPPTGPQLWVWGDNAYGQLGTRSISTLM